jgi:hypothetical protein
MSLAKSHMYVLLFTFLVRIIWICKRESSKSSHENTPTNDANSDLRKPSEGGSDPSSAIELGSEQAVTQNLPSKPETLPETCDNAPEYPLSPPSSIHTENKRHINKIISDVTGYVDSPPDNRLPLTASFLGMEMLQLV